MPRPVRVWFPGAWYHVMARGNNREAIFFSTKDYPTYLALLRRALRRYRCRVHAYALMTNHLHLMVETGDQYPISALMHWLHTSYTSYVNRQYQRVGHVFQGRFQSVLVDADSYALALSRYIHLNPVQAGMVARPEDYAWSSYRAYTGLAEVTVVTTQFLLSCIASNKLDQAQQYQQFVLDGLSRECQTTPVIQSGGLTPVWNRGSGV